MAVAMFEPTESWRRPGCGPGCRRVLGYLAGEEGRGWIELHDADAHEQFGERVARANGQTLGPFRLDQNLGRLYIDGHDVGLTRTEFELVAYLAARLRTVVSRGELGLAIWGVDDDATRHAVRVVVARTRAKFGPAYRDLLETHASLGLRLVTEPTPGYEAQPLRGCGRLGWRQLGLLELLRAAPDRTVTVETVVATIWPVRRQYRLHFLQDMLHRCRRRGYQIERSGEPETLTLVAEPDDAEAER